MKDAITIVVVPQEHDGANHLGLWQELAKQSDGPTVVVNISADLVVSIVKRRWFRIREAIIRPYRQVGFYHLLRPIFILRPEVSSRALNLVGMRVLVRQLNRRAPELSASPVRVLVYSGLWADLFREVIPHATIGYYVLDEVTRTASNDELHAQRTVWDRIGCQKSDAVFLMSSALVSPREDFASKLLVIGNGADAPPRGSFNRRQSDSSGTMQVGLVGNIRDWIDVNLLEGLVRLRPDLEFGLVGNIESNMSEYIKRLCSVNANVKYHGKVPKSEVVSWYRRFDVIIVPYLRNSFVAATRPIKIVEAIFAGVPVVTVPVAGYGELPFLRFANSVEEFSAAINDVRPINPDDDEYTTFVDANSWRSVARTIVTRWDRCGTRP